MPGPPGPNPFNPQPAFVPTFSNNMGPVPPKVDLSDETFEQWAQAEKDRQRWNWELSENQRMIVEMAAAADGRMRVLEALAMASGFPTRPGSAIEVPPLKPLDFRPWKGREKPRWTLAPGSLTDKPAFSVERVGPPPKPPLPDRFDRVGPMGCGPFRLSMELDGRAALDREQVSLSFTQPVGGWNRVVFTLVLTAADGARAEVDVNAYATHAGGPWHLTTASPFPAVPGQPSRRIRAWEIKSAKTIDLSSTLTALQQAPASPFGVKGSEYIDTTARTPMPGCNQKGTFK